MWLVAEYQSVSLFSLKVSTATSSGGKTLLVPTPYAVKMAVLDVACRSLGVRKAETLWADIRDANIAIKLAPQVVVTNLFQKIQKPTRGDSNKEGEAFSPTIGYREYAQLSGNFQIGLTVTESLDADLLQSLLININYFGKRGGFVQLMQPPQVFDELSEDFVVLTENQSAFPFGGVMQIMDDCAPSLTFEKANIYSGKRVTVGKERIQRNIVLPYKLKRSSRSFSVYEHF